MASSMIPGARFRRAGRPLRPHDSRRHADPARYAAGWVKCPGPRVLRDAPDIPHNPLQRPAGRAEAASRTPYYTVSIHALRPGGKSNGHFFSFRARHDKARSGAAGLCRRRPDKAAANPVGTPPTALNAAVARSWYCRPGNPAPPSGGRAGRFSGRVPPSLRHNALDAGPSGGVRERRFPATRAGPVPPEGCP